jgi:hypothetical protein
MTPPSNAVIAATLLTADLRWQQQFRNAARRTVGHVEFFHRA